MIDSVLVLALIALAIVAVAGAGFVLIERTRARVGVAGRPQSAFIRGDVKDSVFIDCETDADVFIAGSAENVTMENVRHTPSRRALTSTPGEWSEEAQAKCETADWVQATEHELGIKGHEATCSICGPKRTCRQLDRVGALGMVAWCPIGQGEAICASCAWTGLKVIEK